MICTKRFASSILLSLLLSLPLTGCVGAPGETPPSGASQPATEDGTDNAMQAILSSYREAQSSPAFAYFQHNSIQKFLAMWVKEATGDIDSPQWDLDSFTAYEMRGADTLPAAGPEEQNLYYCTFSGDGHRYGYVIFRYNEGDPSIENMGVGETTPYQYDLEANLDAIAAALVTTDIDLSTATATRISWAAQDNSIQQAILFADAKQDRYLCCFGGPSWEIEKIG